MSFRLKLLASFTGLLAAVLAACLLVVGRVERRQAEAQTRAGLETTRQVFSGLLEERQRALVSSLRLLAGDYAFKQAVSTGDPATVLSLALNHRARIRSDLLLIADADGKVLADTRRALRPGAPVPLGVVTRALEGRQAAEVSLVEGTPYQLVAVPIEAPDVIGAVAAGFLIDDRLARSLKALTRSEVAFVAGERVLAATARPGLRGELPGTLHALGAEPRVVQEDGERWLAASEDVGAGLRAVIMRSWDEALAPERALQRLLLMLGALGLLVTALVGVGIASSVTASLRQLSAATERIARGEYEVSLDIRSGDEIATLGRSFMAMAKGLVEREKIRSVLRKAVSKEIAESLLAQGRIELGGEERTVTVLFSDVRSFTTLSEGLPPKRLVDELNAYFTLMARAIEAHHGVIDKYVGDAVMALFGAPLAGAEDAANAVRAALAMRRALSELNAERARAGLPAWETGIGLNTGVAVAGTLGSADRWSYTVIGDSVNLASRLEGLTKRYGAPIVVSESTRRAAGSSFVFRTLEEVVVKGRHEPVAVYEVLGEGQAPAWLDDFERGVRCCRAGRWDEARQALERVAAAAPADGPAGLYLKRALERSEIQPTRMREK